MSAYIVSPPVTARKAGAEHREANAGPGVEEIAQRAERASRGQDGGCAKDPGEAENAGDDDES
jgi:hypothetical protein